DPPHDDAVRVRCAGATGAWRKEFGIDGRRQHAHPTIQATREYRQMLVAGDHVIHGRKHRLQALSLPDRLVARLHAGVPEINCVVEVEYEPGAGPVREHEEG